MFVRLFICSSFVHIVTLNPLPVDLVGQIAYFQDEAFGIYNDYAFKVGFSVRYHKVRANLELKKLSMRQFGCCWKEGWKDNRDQPCKQYTSVDVSGLGVKQ